MMLTCNKCGWVHFSVTRQYAEDQVQKFNDFYDKSEPYVQAMYGNHKSSIATYEHCMRCGNTYKDFRVSKENDCPAGCTINPIIYEESNG